MITTWFVCDIVATWIDDTIVDCNTLLVVAQKTNSME